MIQREQSYIIAAYVHVHGLPVRLSYLWRRYAAYPCHGCKGTVAKRGYNTRTHRNNFAFQQFFSRSKFFCRRRAISHAARTALYRAEFHRVCHEHVAARYARKLKQLVKLPARLSNERMPSRSFLPPGRFADQHQMRRKRPFAEHRVQIVPIVLRT